MNLLSIIAALILEQLRPLSDSRALIRPLSRYARFLENQFNDGQSRHGTIAWFLAVAPPVIGLAGLDAWLWAYQPLFLPVVNIAVLYLTVGFRQFSHYFTDIHLALRIGDPAEARRVLAEWRRGAGDRLSSGEIARLAIEQALICSHRHVFAPLVWFAVFGPAGALLYRMAMFFDAEWGCRDDAEFGSFGWFSRRAFYFIDWFPLRLTATAFAVVGDFEDAIYCWRTQASRWPDSSGILLASGAGAVGVRLGLPIHEDLATEEVGSVMRDRPELGLGDEADADLMQSAIGLVWRTLVLGLLLVGLVWVASWVG